MSLITRSNDNSLKNLSPTKDLVYSVPGEKSETQATRERGEEMWGPRLFSPPSPLLHLKTTHQLTSLGLPFNIMSKCSHRMSPMNGGTRARNPSFPRPHISLPRMLKLLVLTPSSENSLMAQFSQCLMSESLQSRGSV